MQTLVWITGFPRTGTSWLFRQLRKCRECDWIPEEQGLPFLWAARHGVDYDAIMSAAWEGGRDAYDVALIGCHAVKHVAARPVWTLDGLTRPRDGKRHWLTKTPTMEIDPTFPSAYIARSGRWGRSVVLCCRRDPAATWESGVRKWPHWQSQWPGEAFLDAWHDYYCIAADRGWMIVDHAEMAIDGQQIIDTICDFLRWRRVTADPFLTSPESTA